VKGIGISTVRIASFGAVTALLAMGLLAGPSASEAAVKQPNCAKAKAKVRKAKGAKKRAAKRSLKRCKDNLTVYRQIVISRITGTRADGVQIDDLYCPRGRWQSDVAQGGKVHKTGWYVESARLKSRKKYTAIVVGKLAGGTHQISIARNGAKWKVGWVYFGEAKDLGDATVTKPAKECAGL